MEMTERRIPSVDGVHQLYCRVYMPDVEIKGLFHVAHGMTEHIRRDGYDNFMRVMAEHGYICYGYDHLGHGYTVKDESELGYLGEWKLLVKDVQNVSKLMKEEFGKDLPCYLLGHSMGSFIVRCASTPAIWDKVIYMGTGGPNPASKAGLAMISRKIKKKGGHAVDISIEKLVFGSYCKHFKNENDSIAWLSTKKDTRDVYRDDDLCGFHFTLNGFYTLIKLQSLSNSKNWFKEISDKLPILLVSGGDDPVGNYGKGVKTVYKNLKKNGKNVQMKLYDGCRHEILNDVCREEVINDILTFVES